jgi:hypothetical protein
MDNPDDEKTIINVKAVSVSSWERAKKAANRNGETLGSWLSRACDQLANLDAGDRLILPSANPVNPSRNLAALPPVDFHEVAAIIMAMKEAGLPVQKRIGQHVNALLHTKLREARGEPEKGRGGRLIHGLAAPENGKAISHDLDARDEALPKSAG